MPQINFSSITVGKRVAQFRRQNGLTQQELANGIGVPRYIVSDCETGRIHLNDEMIIRFSCALNITADELLGMNGKTNQSNTDSSRRIMRRLRQIESLPETRKKTILHTLDDLIRANS
jgi:plasmid maintenance system antidote protein VapI